MPVVTLTSDLGSSDHYAGAIKGALLSLDDTIRLIDISSQIPAFDVQRAIFCLRSSYGWFPKGTLHLFCVQPIHYSEQPMLLFESDGHYFCGPDNGLISLITNKPIGRAIRLNTPDAMLHSASFSFPFFFRRALQAVNQENWDSFGEQITPDVRSMLDAFESNDKLNGYVIQIDVFGNVITNITREKFERFTRGNRFEVRYRSTYFTRISEHYSEHSPGDGLVLFNSLGLLEIAINQGTANSLIGIELNDKVVVLLT